MKISVDEKDECQCEEFMNVNKGYKYEKIYIL